MLKHIKVVELSSVLAGPLTGVFFAELGARVYKVENKLTGGDITRKWKLPSEDKSKKDSAYYKAVNHYKKVVYCDLSNVSDYNKTISLIKTADVLISNFKKGDDLKFKLDYKRIKKINPKLIYAVVSSYGTDSDRTAFDIVLQAETGYLSMTGHKNKLAKIPVAFIDIVAAHYLKEGILLALLKREKSGKGSLVHVSLFDAAIASLINQASNYFVAGKIAKPMGLLHPNIAPYGELFNTFDKKQIVLAVGTDKQFSRLCEALNCKSILSDDTFLTNAKRVKRRILLQKKLAPYFLKLKADDIIRLLIKHKVPAGKINNINEVLANPKISKRLVYDNNIPVTVLSNAFSIK